MECEDTRIALRGQRKGPSVVDGSTGRCYLWRAYKPGPFSAWALPLPGAPLGQEGGLALLTSSGSAGRMSYPSLGSVRLHRWLSPLRSGKRSPRNNPGVQKLDSFWMQVSRGMHPRNASPLLRLLMDVQPTNGTRPALAQSKTSGTSLTLQVCSHRIVPPAQVGTDRNAPYI